MIRGTNFAMVLSVAALVLTGALVIAGPLSPPAGPVASTYKTLIEVEPRIAINATNTPGDADSVFRITQPGSYYLTGNVTGVSGRSGIEIAASNVTIDLNGFEVAGVAGSLSGVVSSGAITGIRVKNGTVRAWGAAGVLLTSTQVTMIRDIIAISNAGAGIACGSSASVSGCVVRQNGVGIVCADKAVVTDCTSSLNIGNGIQVGDASSVTNCSADDNGGNGINAGFLCTISACTASRNTLDGINVLSSCIIVDCTASENDGDGIDVEFYCVVRGNTCSRNTVAGIRVEADRNRIEGNNCSRGGTGILVSGTQNIIIGNNCGGNITNYNIVAGNRYGPIINATAPAAPAGIGNSAPSTLLTTDPHANIAH